ncbi:hypothetical protein [Anaeromyxobacter paludicola]|uniref:Uncharacterized protein n=1 Tax=Anaeromyxobacter paludicola TaxID=2918171 RepID=A0ABN6N1K5_9BACT|nr:hypothetical protein [Anaeromyxobacter paludicola]BDG07097.1 hypothetical protein AMPC_02100 [Anaeromyxobacter paludicola]
MTALLALLLAAAPLALETPADADRLCRALAPEPRREAGGERSREEALAARYRARVAARGLRLQPWDPEEERLALDPAAYLAAAGGALRLWAPGGAGELAVPASRAVLDRLLAAREAGRLALEVTFALRAEPGDSPCARVAGGRAGALEIVPVAWAWLDGEEAIAAGASEPERPAFRVADGARPTVTVDPAPLGAAAPLQARASLLEGCYREALARRPALDGALVLELAPGAAPRVAADTVLDEPLAACVARVAAPVRAAARTHVPVRFELEPPATARAVNGG